MSLDIYLEYPYLCPHCGKRIPGKGDDIFSQNITHNLIPMAEEAGIYKILWRPEENGIETAAQLITPLEIAIAAMESDPPRFEAFNAKNGWGLYENFLPWLKRLLGACQQNRELSVYSSQ